VIERITEHARDTAKQLNVLFHVKNALKFKLIRFEPQKQSGIKKDIAAKRRKKHKSKFSLAVISIGYEIEIPEI
jgi:hypothetical protein